MHKLYSLLKNKVFFSALLLVAVLSITTVCASFNQQMYISGDAYLRVDRDIRITSVKMTNPTNEAYESYNSKYAVNNVSLYPALPNIDSTITYQVTIENKSDDIYMITSIENDFNNASIKDTENNYLKQLVAAHSTVTLDITFSYNTENLPENTKQSGTITFAFERPSAALIEYTSSHTSCDNVQCALDELFEIYQ